MLNHSSTERIFFCTRVIVVVPNKGPCARVKESKHRSATYFWTYFKMCSADGAFSLDSLNLGQVVICLNCRQLFVWLSFGNTALTDVDDM